MNSPQIKFAANLIVGGKDSIMQAVALSGGYSNKIQPGQHKLIRPEEKKKRVAVWWGRRCLESSGVGKVLGGMMGGKARKSAASSQCGMAIRPGSLQEQGSRWRVWPTWEGWGSSHRTDMLGKKKKKTIAMPSSIKLVEKGPVISGWRVSLSRTSLPELSSHPQLSQFWREGTCSCSQLLPWGAVVAEPSTPARVPGAPSPFRDG